MKDPPHGRRDGGPHPRCSRPALSPSPRLTWPGGGPPVLESARGHLPRARAKTLSSRNSATPDRVRAPPRREGSRARRFERAALATTVMNAEAERGSPSQRASDAEDRH